MKKLTVMAAVLAASFTLSSCMMGGGGKLASASGTSTPSSNAAGLGNIASSLASTSGSGILGGLLNSILGNKTSEQTIQGTWPYSKPKVVFESESVLAKIGSNVASSKIESNLESQLKKIGFSAGKSQITFNADGTYVMALGKKNYNGTYTFDSASSTMTLKGALGVTTLTCNVSVVGNELYMLFGADKLLSVASAVSSVNSTLSSLLSNYNGLKLGWAMTK